MNLTDNFTKAYLQTNLGVEQKSIFPIHDVILKEIICCTEVSKLEDIAASGLTHNNSSTCRCLD